MSSKFVAKNGLVAAGLTYPTADATSGYVLTTNGSGLLSLQAPAAGAGITSVTSSGTTLTLNWSGIGTYYVTLASATVAITNSGAVDGQKLNLVLIQDGTGGRAVTWTSETTFGTDITSFVPSATASKQDHVGIIYNNTAAKYRVVGTARGF